MADCEYCFLLQKRARGEDLLNTICENLNLLEKDYFALSFKDKNDVKVGVDMVLNVRAILVQMICVVGKTGYIWVEIMLWVLSF